MTVKYTKNISASSYGSGISGRDLSFSQFQSTIESYAQNKRSKQSSLKILRRARSLTLEALSELTGISPSYLSRLESGGRRLNTDLLERLSAVLGCQPGDLLNNGGSTSAGAAFMGQSRTRAAGRADSAPIEVSHLTGEADLRLPQKDLPVYTVSTSLGVFPGATTQASMVDFSTPADWTLRPPQLLGIPKAFALYVGDEGYAPRYMSGDILLVHPSRPLLPRCSVVVLTKDERALVRQFHGWAQNTILLSCFDTREEAEGMHATPKEDLKAVYKIIGTIEAY